MKMRGFGVGIGVLVSLNLFLGHGCRPDPILLPALPDILSEPIQETVAPGPRMVMETGYGRFVMVPRFSYRIAGVVIGVQRYRAGWEASLSPSDIALLWGAWGERAEELIRRITMRNRGYEFATHALITRGMEEMPIRTSNNHLIPADARVRFGIGKIRDHDRVLIQGFLVDVYGSSGRGDYSWKTSVERTDTGAGGCEVILVHSLQVNLQVFGKGGIP